MKQKTLIAIVFFMSAAQPALIFQSDSWWFGGFINVVVGLFLFYFGVDLLLKEVGKRIANQQAAEILDKRSSNESKNVF